MNIEKLEQIKDECRKIIALHAKTTPSTWHNSAETNEIYGSGKWPSTLEWVADVIGDQDREFITVSHAFSPAAAKATLDLISLVEEVRAHQVANNQAVGRPIERSKTIAIIDQALQSIVDNWTFQP